MLSTRLRLACAIAGSCAAIVACSALVGVEDVTLARARDGAAELDALTADEAAVLDASGAAAEASVELAAGALHTCARKADGKIRCWGDNGAGQIGDGLSFDAGARPSVLVPQEVLGISGAIDVASGNAHSCAILAGGTVKCWGLNFFGQLGDGTTNRSSTPVAVNGVTGALALAAGTSFTCALLSDRTVSCWGANAGGQLGDGTKNDRGTPAPVKNLSGVLGLTAGELHACAVITGGAVMCWGKNDDGQLGNGSTSESLVPTAIPSLADIVQVAAASRFTCALQRGGQVNCWGANELGELGTGSPNSAANPSPAITQVKDAIAIWVGFQHACAVRRSGAVACWGEAGEGQIGSGSVPADASIPQPTAVVGVTQGLAVSTGGAHSCVTTAGGAVLCWGANSLGQLGNGTTQGAYAAVPVTGFP